MLKCLAFSIGGSLDARVMLHLVNEHEGSSAHYNSERQLSYDRWRLIYLARHARIEPGFFDDLSSREVEEWIVETSEMLKAEMGKGKK